MRPEIDRPAACIGSVQIYLCRIGCDADLAGSSSWAMLGDEERTRADRFRFARDRDRFVQSMGFLRRILGAATGQSPAGLRFERTHGGKPFLPAGSPLFNLSHSGAMAALAVSHAEAVGIDVEDLGRLPDAAPDFDVLTESCFLPDEAAAIRSAPNPRQSFLQFWTAKEARMKLTGEGLSLEPHSIALTHVDGIPSGYLLPASPVASLHLLDLGTSAVALARGPANLHLLR